MLDVASVLFGVVITVVIEIIGIYVHDNWRR
jgi:hypothetical protein